MFWMRNKENNFPIPTLIWRPVYIEGLQIIISKAIVFISLKIDFIFCKQCRPDEMSPCAAFHLGLRCLPQSLFRGSQSSKGEQAEKGYLSLPIMCSP